LKTFLEFKLDPQNSMEFFQTIRSMSDPEICAMLELPLPGMVRMMCPHLSADDAYSLSVALHQLTQELRKVTDQGEAGALALAQIAGQMGGAVLASDARWLDGSSNDINPDQVALLVLDSRRRNIYVQGLTADEGSMGRVVDAVDTATRAASNLIYAYLQTNNL
ncbi:MAG TPA: hypothetical protein VFX19_02230, partial [Dehalococcoidia bacterium]|nr:hypothetical protein [Dehalococcoidia bacterium]